MRVEPAPAVATSKQAGSNEPQVSAGCGSSESDSSFGNMWGGSTSEADRAKNGLEGHGGSTTLEQLAASELRTQKRLGEMQDALNLILQRLPDRGLGPSSLLPAPTTPAASSRSVGFAVYKSPSFKKGGNLAEASSMRNAASADDEDPASRLRRHGTLTVHIKSAINLIKADFGGLSDPYVQITVAGQHKKCCKTIKKNLNPVSQATPCKASPPPTSHSSTSARALAAEPSHAALLRPPGRPLAAAARTG